MTSLRGSLLRLLVCLTTTRSLPSVPERSRLLSGFFCLVSWLSTPSLRAPRLSPSTLHPNKLIWTNQKNGPFQGHQLLLFQNALLSFSTLRFHIQARIIACFMHCCVLLLVVTVFRYYFLLVSH